MKSFCKAIEIKKASVDFVSMMIGLFIIVDFLLKIDIVSKTLDFFLLNWKF
jgi:hypothetical protein